MQSCVSASLLEPIQCYIYNAICVSVLGIIVCSWIPFLFHCTPLSYCSKYVFHSCLLVMGTVTAVWIWLEPVTLVACRVDGNMTRDFIQAQPFVFWYSFECIFVNVPGMTVGMKMGFTFLQCAENESSTSMAWFHISCAEQTKCYRV